MNAVGEGDHEKIHSLLVDGDHEILLAKHVNSRCPLSNTFVARSLAGTHEFGQVTANRRIVLTL